jgi:hypothetical protein
VSGREVVSKRRAAALAAAQQASAVLIAARKELLAVMRPWRKADRQLRAAVKQLQAAGAYKPGGRDERDLLVRLLCCIASEREASARVTQELERMGASP